MLESERGRFVRASRRSLSDSPSSHTRSQAGESRGTRRLRDTGDNPAFLTSLSSSSDPGEQIKVMQQAEETVTHS